MIVYNHQRIWTRQTISIEFSVSYDFKGLKDWFYLSNFQYNIPKQITKAKKWTKAALNS